MNTRVNHYLEAMYGGLPPAGVGLRTALAHELRRDGEMLQIWRVSLERPGLSWLLNLAWRGNAPGPFAPILLSPDACWPHCVNESAERAVLEQGVALASFNRLDLAADPPDGRRGGPLIEAWPSLPFGALSAWAWGIGCTAQALQQLYPLAQIGVVGHSRGGKSALLAAACHSGIAAVISHNSGTVGASSLQHMSTGSESLASLAQAFPHWLGPAAQQASVQQELMVDDGAQLWQHIAPRGLMIIQAQDDAWANPLGARRRFEQLKPHWGERPQALQLVERSGAHAMGSDDWRCAAGFLRQLDPALRQ